jgi:GTP cyclohydrolase FolE2
MTLEDVPGHLSTRGRSLDEVRVIGVRCPAVTRDRGDANRETLGETTTSVALPATVHGIHLKQEYAALEWPLPGQRRSLRWGLR